MKILTGLVLTALFGMAALPAYACTPEEAQAKAEEVAETIHRLADGDQAKANELHKQLLGLQLRDPTRSDHGACEAYDRINKELKEKAGE
ncbi:hypothetical protein DT594_01305 [Halopseudomonas laoshanensis]|uniref:Lipoprotein n=1 Tax=Halopseudomonas laoshanensis TaxID=2268758 RepID=A0A7V7GW34_9GAMM|nr:hypothetical protein [Halopseudomonas laoshanensis]KAA0696030.1 hypothetical protein DT594_01305 [Halopseudomonas laoshanensis]MBQ0742706.1 hypothetical protein [Pseudomonas sp.]MBQ0776046.1 hypothetical protein [Pseudomonas sp.]